MENNILEDLTESLEVNLTSTGAASYYKPKEYAKRRFDTINEFCTEKLEDMQSMIADINSIIPQNNKKPKF
jgi:DNA-directed RNA polymerase specialized sigma54-like protein